uniref:Uncharacterized protein n=1 Tax=Arundo donax TaxID=35708 RepID=A0A0A9GRJ4_ARUDO
MLRTKMELFSLRISPS